MNCDSCGKDFRNYEYKLSKFTFRFKSNRILKLCPACKDFKILNMSPTLKKLIPSFINEFTFENNFISFADSPYDYYAINAGRISAIKKDCVDDYEINGRSLEARKRIGTFLKVGKFLKYVTGSINQKTADTISNYLKNTNSCNVFKISADVENIYNKPHSPHHTTKESCMKGCGEFYQHLKEQLKEDLKILYTENENGELSGRCLLWAQSNGNIYADRIYSESQALEAEFLDYIKLKNWIYRNTQSMGFRGATKNGVSFELDTIYFNFDESKTMPYMDTYGNYENGELIPTTDSRHEIQFDDTNGGYSGGGICCEYCGDRTNDDEAIYIPDNGVSYCCNECANQHDYYWSNYHSEYINISCGDYAYLESEEDYIHLDYCVSCNNCGEFMLSDNNDYITTDDGIDFCCKSCAENSDYIYSSYLNEWLHVDYAFICQSCGEVHSEVDDMEHAENGDIYCSDCYAETIEEVNA